MKYRRSIAFILSMSIIFTMFSGTVFAKNSVPLDSNVSDSNLYSILDNYHLQNMMLSDDNTLQSYMYTTVSPHLDIQNSDLVKATISDLRNAGYEAYAINEQNYLEIETTLNTDFSNLDFGEGQSYIAVVHGLRCK